MQDHGTTKHQGLTSSTPCSNSSFGSPQHPSAPSSALLPHLMDVWIPACWHPPNQDEWESPVNASPDFSTPAKTSKRRWVCLTAPQHSEEKTSSVLHPTMLSAACAGRKDNFPFPSCYKTLLCTEVSSKVSDNTNSKEWVLEPV